jgi:hypothetical protein
MKIQRDKKYNANRLQCNGKERKNIEICFTSIVVAFVDVPAVPEPFVLPAQYSLHALPTPHAAWKSSRQ